MNVRPCPDEACGSQLRGAIAGCKCGCRIHSRRSKVAVARCICEVQLRGQLFFPDGLLLCSCDHVTQARDKSRDDTLACRSVWLRLGNTLLHEIMASLY